LYAGLKTLRKLTVSNKQVSKGEEPGRPPRANLSRLMWDERIV
jgi:hypothetical protein